MLPIWPGNVLNFATWLIVANLFPGIFSAAISWMVFPILLSKCALGGLSNEILAPNSGMKSYPSFVEEIQNITVTSGREAILSCVVENLGDYKVGWLKVDSQTILILQKRVVTHNSRISVTHDEHRTWNLHIKHVKESDRGCYMCQINTPIMANKIGCIEVFVPPNIIDEETSSETTIKESETVVLRCNAVGYPVPEVEWRREDRRAIKIATSGRDFLKMEKVKGENLTLTSVSRRQMGAYLCIASNGVPPIVSKRIQLNVNFSPVVKVNNQLIGAPLGTEVEIQCHVEAFPPVITFWEKGNNEMILAGRKFNTIEELDSYKVTLKLQIRNFTRDDEGQYKCKSKNSLGSAETTIRLYVIDVPSPKSTTEQQSHVSTLSPSNSVSSLDLRKSKDLKKAEIAGDTEISNHSSKRHQEKHRFNNEFDDTAIGSSGLDNGLMESNHGFSRTTYHNAHFIIVMIILFILSVL